MALATTRRGAVSAPVTKLVAAAQAWRCAGCDELLPAAFQIDHRVPLWRGGPDAADNLQALCPNCHAAKTQQEAVDRRLASARRDKADAYDTREDVVVAPRRFRCTACLRERPFDRPHPVCWALERRFSADTRLAGVLAQFAWQPRSAGHIPLHGA